MSDRTHHDIHPTSQHVTISESQRLLFRFQEELFLQILLMINESIALLNEGDDKHCSDESVALSVLPSSCGACDIISMEQLKAGLNKHEALIMSKLESKSKVISVLADCSCVRYMENEWLSKEYIPFYNRYKHNINAYQSACLNPLLLRVLLEDESIDRSRRISDMSALSENSALTLNVLSDYGNLQWNWLKVSSNPNITMQDIINHPEYPWHWGCVSRNPNLTMSMILQYPDKSWNWADISGITMQDIINHPEYPWNWNTIFSNKFTLDKSLYMNTVIN